MNREILHGWGSPNEMKAYVKYAEAKGKPTEAKIVEMWLTTPMTVQQWDVPSHLSDLEPLVQSCWGPAATLEPSKYAFALVLRRSYVVSMIMFEEEVVKDFKMYTMWNGCTHPRCRKQGYYTQLLNAAKQICEEKRHYLVLHVVETNTNAINLYQKHGFTCVPKIQYQPNTLCLRWIPSCLQKKTLG